MPWEGGVKIYYNEIFALQKTGEEEYSWKVMNEKIPFASAYGGVVSTPNGLLCFGGDTVDKTISESWYIKYIPEKEKVEITQGPQLPLLLTNFVFAKVDNQIFIAAGISDFGGESGKHFLSFDISTNDPLDWYCESLPAWEGNPRAFAVGAGQSNGETSCFYLFSGRNIKKNGDVEILYDAHVYNPSLRKWSLIADGSFRIFL